MNAERFDQISENMLEELKELFIKAEVIGVYWNPSTIFGDTLKLHMDDEYFFEIAGDRFRIRDRKNDGKYPYEAFFENGSIEAFTLLSENEYQALIKNEEVHA